MKLYVLGRTAAHVFAALDGLGRDADRPVEPRCGRDGDGALLLPMVNLEIEAKLTAESL